jgi:hypothetical protein
MSEEKPMTEGYAALRRIWHLFFGHPAADTTAIPMGHRCRCGAEFGRWDYP